ncbi:MAG: hypothetical protein ABW139_00020 [Candidatus Thiodiazotropha sp. DIVDIV]
MSHDLDWAVSGPPVGTWTTSNGTFDGVMLDTLTIAADGTGWLKTFSPMRGAELFPLMWIQASPGVLKLALLFPDDDPTEAPQYETVRYNAVEVSRDVGNTSVVLQNDDDDVFWNLVGPVSLESRVPRAP